MTMKIAVFNCRPDERGLFEFYKKKYQIELKITTEAPTVENYSFVQGCQAVSAITTPIDGELLRAWKEAGIRAVSTRTVGYDHIDLETAKKLNIPISNVSYTPHTVAEYTVMTILMAIRRMKTILTRYQVQDYSLTDVRGKELRNMTVGVVGTGNHDMAVLNAMPNVLMTPHTAFFTDEAVGDMIRYSLESCIAEIEGKEDPRRIC